MTSGLAFTLSSCGYDVWLSNSRGSDYSKKHIVYDSNTGEYLITIMTMLIYVLLDPEYWEFTFTELGVYDARTVVEYVMNVTSQGENCLI